MGHQVSIVGYVMPTSGKQTPYYIVWNPWWNTTFYLSTNAKTFNLGGVKYRWLRTWHNWKKVSPASRSVQSIKPEIGKEKVASAANPMALKENTKLPLNVATPDAIALILGGGYEIDNTVKFAETLILYHKTSSNLMIYAKSARLIILQEAYFLVVALKLAKVVLSLMIARK